MKRSFEQVIWARRWFVLGVLVVAALLTPMLRKMTIPTYSASAELAYVGNSLTAVVSPPDLPELATSSRVLKAAIKNANLQLQPEQLAAGIAVRQSPHSDIIPISFRSKDRGLAIQASNAVADATVAEYHRLSTQQYDLVIGNLQGQMSGLRNHIRDLDRQYQRTIAADPVAGTVGGVDQLAARLDDAEKTRSAAAAKLAADEAAAATTQASYGTPEMQSVIREESLQHDPATIALQTEQAKDNASLVKAQAGYTSAFPGLSGMGDMVRRESDALRHSADEGAAAHRGASTAYAAGLTSQVSAQSLVAADKADLASVNGDYDRVQQRLANLPSVAIPANDLRIQRESAATVYGQVESRLRGELADKVFAASLNSIVLLDHASAAAPSESPRFAAAMIVFVIFALAIGAAYLVEMLDPRIRTRTDVEDLYGTPLVGSL